MKISGQTFEFEQKHIFSPGMMTHLRDVSVYADDIGKKTITVRFTEYMPEFPSRAMNMLKTSVAVKELVNRLIFGVIDDKTNWKNPAWGAFWTEGQDMNTAMFLANEIQKQVGGAWIIQSSSDGRLYVWSKGYYHYIGA